MSAEPPITIIEGMPRPRAVDVAKRGGCYYSLRFGADGAPTSTEHRVDVVTHLPCGWQHPTWPDEVEGRLQAHLATCEMRMGDDDER